MRKTKKDFSILENIRKRSSTAIQESENIAIFLKYICKKSAKFSFAKKA